MDMADLKTVDGTSGSVDPLIGTQREDVAKMRASLLALSGDPSLAVQSIRNITVLRVYHQISRIVQYLDMMDKIEAKLYECIDVALADVDPMDPATSLPMLLTLQERLQKTMIESHKLLQPYLSIEEFGIMEIDSSSSDTSSTLLIDKSSRDKIRNSAQQVLSLLEDVENE